VSKGSSKKADAKKKDKEDDDHKDEELILTNTGLTHGFHFWEIICSISCRNIKIGVFNPITKCELLTTFITHTKRTITVGLDLNEGLLKFWLNGHRQDKKT